MHIEKKYWGDHNVEFEKVYFNSPDDMKKEKTHKPTSKSKLVFKNKKMARKMGFKVEDVLIKNR